MYTQRRVTVVADWKAEDIPQYDNWQRELWFNMPYQDTQDWLIDKKTFLSRWNSEKRLFVLMNSGYYPQFSVNIKNKIPETVRSKIFVFTDIGVGYVNKFDTGAMPESFKALVLSYMKSGSYYGFVQYE